MPSGVQKRARAHELKRGQPKKKIRLSKKQRRYDSDGSEDESETEETRPQTTKPILKKAAAVPNEKETPTEDADDVNESDDVRDDFDEEELEAADAPDSEDDADEMEGTDINSDADTDAPSRKKKRQDPEAFATSISKILGSKLSTSKRADPVLARSKDAATATKEMAEARLEVKAKNKLREEKRAVMEKGHVTDVLALADTDQSTAKVLEEERRLKKVAQRGVVTLFNAVRAAQVKGEEAAKEARRDNVVGLDKREKMATEMSKQSFLDLIASGGKKTAATA